MVNSVTHAIPTDPSVYVSAAQYIQGIEPSKPISRAENWMPFARFINT